jgi:DNA-directed RNA polymerase beta' subunit
MKAYVKKIFLSLCFAATCTASLEARTFAERGRDLGQKLDDAEAKLKKEVEEAKKKAQDTADRIKKKSDKVAQTIKEEENKEESTEPAVSEVVKENA